MRVLVVDHQDSFTYNVVEELRRLGAEVTVADVDDPGPDPSRADAVVLSPGPGRPRDGGLARRALDSGRPVLGVCLGHQLMALRCGGEVARVAPVHGVATPIEHDGRGLFRGLPQGFSAVRYNSLAVTEVPGELLVTARSPDGVVEGIRHVKKPWWGVQFHPESVGTKHGREILANFLELAGLPRLRRRRIPVRVRPEDVFASLFDGVPGSFFLDSPDGWVAMGAGRLRELPDWGVAGLGAPPAAQPAAWPFGFRPGWVVALDYEAARGHVIEAPRAVVVGPEEVSLVWRSSTPSHPAAEDPGDDGEYAAEARWLEETERRICAVAAEDRPPARGRLPRAWLRFRDSREAYLKKIADAQERIAAGDTYEVCLTTQIEGRVERELGFGDFLRLRDANPTGRGGFMGLGNLTMLSSSPELFLSVVDGRVISKPIKGTRPADADPAELARHPKDCAENLMIVDLVRNDLTRVAVPGTVRVDKFLDVESYATVHQLVSTVSAELRTASTEAIRAAFPGGSMTGAPKESTMEILSRLEGAPRGLYSGAFGYLGADGSLGLSMTIRTIVARGRDIGYGVGGAILAASDPAAEWEEILVKAQPLLRLVDAAGIEGEDAAR